MRLPLPLNRAPGACPGAELSRETPAWAHIQSCFTATRRRSRQASSSLVVLQTVSEQSAGSGLIHGERKEVAIPSTTLVKRVGTGPPPGVRCGRGSPHAFGRSTSRIARRGVPRAHRISPTEIAPRFECRRARSCEVTRPPLDLHSRFLPFTRPRPCSMDRRSSAQTCGLAKEGF